MPELIVIYWRDIPAQVVAKQGRQRARQQLSGRFQKGIDRAAMRAKKTDSDAYLEDWRRESLTQAGDMNELVTSTAYRLEHEYSEERLEQIIRNKGWASHVRTA